MYWNPRVAALLSTLLCFCIPGGDSHARLYEPPGRSSMFRFDFDNPPNYSDNQLNCGGKNNQHSSHGGKCGTCGDPYQDAVPRANERGGKFGKGPAVRTYQQGETIHIHIDVTANHQGYFEIRICPTNNPSMRATQACLDQYLLPVSGSTNTKYSAADHPGASLVKYQVDLPAGLTCSWCVLQWRYRAGNSWGTDPDGTSCVGCGPQEEFYGCADVTITSNDNGQNTPPTAGPSQPPITPAWTPPPTQTRMTTPAWTPPPTQPPMTTPAWTPPPTEPPMTTPSWTPPPTQPPATTPPPTNPQPTPPPRTPAPVQPPAGGEICVADFWRNYPGMKDWCIANCARNFCPESHCRRC